MRPRPTVAIVGLGLIGGSLARALTQAGWRVIGVDRASVLRRARAERAIATAAATPEAAAARAGVVVLAAPPSANLRLLRRLARSRTEAVITDVGSVKFPICREAERLGLASFVGGHPMAGAERSGFGAASADLFRGRPWIVTGGGAAAVRSVRSLVRAAGARPVAMTSEEHDRAAAFLSHAPQVVSWAILEAATRDPVARRHVDIAGPGFRDMTRLAGSSRRLWREILDQNRVEVRRALAALRRALARVPATGR
jgi:prephenate dehydrogenase